jgi:hypothetical protein
MEDNYIWVSENFKKMYLLEPDNKIFESFKETLIKNVNLFVSYDQNNNPSLSCYKTENNTNLFHTELLNSVKTVGDFFYYFKHRQLNCVEFDIELADGTILKTWYGGDLIVYSENPIILDGIINLLPNKLKYFFEEANNIKGKLIKYNDNLILTVVLVSNIEEYLFDNQNYFYDTNDFK